MNKKKNEHYQFLGIVILLSIRLWSFQLIPDAFYDILDLLLVSYLAFICVNFLLKTKRRKLSTIFGKPVLLFLILPFVSAIGALIYHEQGFLDSFSVLRMNFLWLFYFVLHIYNVPVKKVINIMLIVGMVWAGITIFQQFTYPYYAFYSKIETADNPFLRAGVYRFFVFRHQYGMFLVLFATYAYLNSFNRKYLLMILLGLIGFYFFGTRQFLAVTVICMGLLLLMQDSRKRVWGLFIIILLSCTVYYLKDDLLGKYIALTKEDLNDDNIRLLAFDFYFNEYWPDDSFSRVIGNGMSYYANSAYGKEITSIETDLKLFRVDVGLVGTYNLYGILYVINIFYYNIKGLRRKYYTASSRYLMTFFLSSLLLLPLTVYYDNPTVIPFFCLISYLVDKAYMDKKTIGNKQLVSKPLAPNLT